MAEYFTDDDRVAVLRKWWDENGTLSVLGLVLVIGAVVGWRWYGEWDRGRQEAASVAYQHYLELTEAEPKDPEQIAVALDQLDKQYAGSVYQIFALFHRAADAVAANDLPGASQLLMRALDGAKTDGLRDLARVRLARVQHQAGQDDQALATLLGVKGAGFRALAAEQKGDILLAQGKRDEALEAYRASQAIEGIDQERPILKMKIADLSTAGAATGATKAPGTADAAGATNTAGANGTAGTDTDAHAKSP